MTPGTDRDELLTVQQAADRLGEAYRTVLQRIHRRELAAVQLGGTGQGRRYRVRASALEAFLAARELPARPPRHLTAI